MVAAIVRGMAQRGYDVPNNCSKSAHVARAAEAACREAGADVLLLQGSVADDAACRAMAAAAMARWGRLDGLVNNAGITTFAGAANWGALDVQPFHVVMDVSVSGAFQMVRACGVHLKAHQVALVNVSSVGGALGIGSPLPDGASRVQDEDPTR